MSIDDDSFDTEAAVLGTDAEKSFDRFRRWAYKMAESVEKLEKENKKLKDALQIVQDVQEEEPMDTCPTCKGKTVRAKTLQEGGGVVCVNPACDYWECY